MCGFASNLLDEHPINIIKLIKKVNSLKEKDILKKKKKIWGNNIIFNSKKLKEELK